ncbi:transcriptional regulator [Streptosporangium sp. NPDC052375]
MQGGGVRFAIPGQTLVTSPTGEPVRLSRTERRVLSALLAADDQGVSSETLIAAVWGDRRFSRTCARKLPTTR